MVQIFLKDPVYVLQLTAIPNEEKYLYRYTSEYVKPRMSSYITAEQREKKFDISKSERLYTHTHIYIYKCVYIYDIYIHDIYRTPGRTVSQLKKAHCELRHRRYA
jgi:hypothetical protein